MRRLAMIVILSFVAFLTISTGTTITNERTMLKNWLKCEAPLTLDNFILALQLEEIEAQYWVIKQANLETGYFTSRRCVEDNNLFGMKMPYVRATTACAETSDHVAIYQTWYDSVEDMKLFQQWYRSHGRDLNDYPSFLQQIYAEDKHYIKKLTATCFKLK